MIKQKYPVERLLRPAVELRSILVAVCASIILVIAPSMFMMTPGVAYGSAMLILMAVVVRRAAEVEPVLKYQRYIRQLPEYKISSPQIPYSAKRLFIGRGFVWTQRHTQRIRDTLRPEVQRYIEQGPFYNWARRKEVEWERYILLKYVAWYLSQPKWWNIAKPLPDVGGLPQLHAIEPQEQEMWMGEGERVGHLVVLGTTRVGKTRLAELLITQDIRRNDVVIVLDPKGDSGLLRRVYAEAKRAGRLDELYIFHLGHPEISARYNGVGNFSRITEVATRVTNPLPKEGNSAAFREFSWRFTNIIARAEVALGKRPNYDSIARYIRNIEPLFIEYCNWWMEQEKSDENWRVEVEKLQNNIDERSLPIALKGRSKRAIAFIRYIRNNNIYEPTLDGLVSAFEYDKTYFDKIVASLLPLLEKLTTGKVAELISPDYTDLEDKRPIFDWLQIIRKRGIVYCGFDALSEPVVSSAVANSMFADLTSIAGRLYKHGVNEGMPEGFNRNSLPNISIHSDEFNEICGDEFVPMLNKAGGANVRNTVYTQVWSDVEARFGSKAKAKQVAGNLNSMIMFRVREEETAEMLTNQLRPVEITTLTEVAGANDIVEPGSPTDFTSNSQDRIQRVEVPMLTPADVMQLPKGQAFALFSGGQLRKLRMPLPDEKGDEKMPKELEAIAEEMERKYRTGENWWKSNTSQIDDMKTFSGGSDEIEREGDKLAHEVEQEQQAQDSEEMMSIS